MNGKKVWLNVLRYLKDNMRRYMYYRNMYLNFKSQKIIYTTSLYFIFLFLSLFFTFKYLFDILD